MLLLFFCMRLYLVQIGGYIISLVCLLWFVSKQFCGLISLIVRAPPKKKNNFIIIFFLYMLGILRISLEIVVIFLWSNCGLKPVKSNYCFILHCHLGILIEYMNFMCFYKCQLGLDTSYMGKVCCPPGH